MQKGTEGHLLFRAFSYVPMVPLIELRGAIPYAVGFELPIVPSCIVAVVGNMIPVPLIYFFARKVLEWGKDKPVIGGFFTFCLTQGEKGGQKLQEKAGQGLFIALMLFVGIPLPGTGAWMGSLMAALFDIKLPKAVLAELCGLILATIIMSLLSYGALGSIFHFLG